MNYYTIDYQVETEETGSVYPQLEICEGANYKDPNSIVNLSRDNNMEKTSSVFELNNKAKLTDYISWNSLKYPIVNNRLKNILMEFNLFDTQFIPVKIKNYELEQWWVLNSRSSNESLNQIDFERTIFGELDPDTKKIVRTFQFSPKKTDRYDQWRKELQQFSEEYHELVIREIHFKKSNKNIDLINISPLLDISGIVVSNKLKEKLKIEKISGITVSNFEWKL